MKRQLVEDDLVDEDAHAAIVIPECCDPKVGIHMILIAKDVVRWLKEWDSGIKAFWRTLGDPTDIFCVECAQGSDDVRGIAVIIERCHRGANFGELDAQQGKPGGGGLDRGFILERDFGPLKYSCRNFDMTLDAVRDL